MRTDPWLSALSRQRSFKAFIAKAEVMADSRRTDGALGVPAGDGRFDCQNRPQMHLSEKVRARRNRNDARSIRNCVSGIVLHGVRRR